MTDTPRPNKPHARRPLPTNPSVMFLNFSIFVPLLFLCSTILPLIFFVIIYAQEDGHFTTLGLAAIFCYVFSWSPLSVVLSPVSAILVIIDRIQRNELNAVTIAFVAFTFAGVLPGALYAILWDVALREYAYKAWLATFEEDWETNGKYKAWWWIFGINKKLMDMANAAEQWMDSKKTAREESDG